MIAVTTVFQFGPSSTLQQIVKEDFRVRQKAGDCLEKCRNKKITILNTKKSNVDWVVHTPAVCLALFMIDFSREIRELFQISALHVSGRC